MSGAVDLAAGVRVRVVVVVGVFPLPLPRSDLFPLRPLPPSCACPCTLAVDPPGTNSGASALNPSGPSFPFSVSLSSLVSLPPNSRLDAPVVVCPLPLPRPLPRFLPRPLAPACASVFAGTISVAVAVAVSAALVLAAPRPPLPRYRFRPLLVGAVGVGSPPTSPPPAILPVSVPVSGIVGEDSRSGMFAV